MVSVGGGAILRSGSCRGNQAEYIGPFKSMIGAFLAELIRFLDIDCASSGSVCAARYSTVMDCWLWGDTGRLAFVIVHSTVN